MSSQLIRVKCDGGVLGCYGRYSCFSDYAEKIRDKNGGKFYCGFCLHKLSRISVNVIESEYNQEMVGKKDSLMAAYILGALYACVNRITESIDDNVAVVIKNRNLTRTLRVLGDEYQFVGSVSPVLAGSISGNRNLTEFIRKYAAEKTMSEIPEMEPLDYQYFLCGFFTFSSDIDWSAPSLTATCNSKEFLEKISGKIPVQNVILKKKKKFSLVYSNANFLDFMGLDLFRDVPDNFREDFNIRNFYNKWNNIDQSITSHEFCWGKVLPEAIAPSKAHFSDSGFDLHLVKKLHTIGNVTYFDTGIAVQCPRGYYFEVYPRSSLTKTGWMLANSVGVIDYGYTNSIIIGLKRDDSCIDIPLPARLVQMIPKRLTLLMPKEVTTFTETTRGGGGFGSTGN